MRRNSENQEHSETDLQPLATDPGKTNLGFNVYYPHQQLRMST